jgi:RNA polymerase-binding transcription factor DksA
MAKKKTPAKKSTKRMAKPATTATARKRGSKKKPAAKSVKKATSTAAKKPVARRPAKATRASPKVRIKKGMAKSSGPKAKRPEKTARKTAKRKFADASTAGSDRDKATTASLATVSKSNAEAAKSKLMDIARSKKHTPAVFKLPTRKNTPIVFSLEDVREALKKSQSEPREDEQTPKPVFSPAKNKAGKSAGSARKVINDIIDKPEHRILGAASVADILGFNPAAQDKQSSSKGLSIPRKYAHYHKLLIELRDHVKSGLDLHTRDTLKRPGKEDTGDSSSYSNHTADSDEDTFDPDFALSLVSNEQEALFEIAEAIERIHRGTYGICEITGQAIKKERLEAVPFTRYSVEGQRQFEGSNRKQIQRTTGVFPDSSAEAIVQFGDGDG